MAEIVSVLSGKGGVGKSTVISALGYSLAAEGKKTLIIELDLGLRGLDLMLSLSDQIVFDLGDLLYGRCMLSDALARSPYTPWLSVIPAPVSPLKELDAGRMAVLLRELSLHFDFILLDMPAGLYLSPSLTALLADTALIVATPDPVSIRSAGKVRALLEEQGFTSHRLLINQFRWSTFKKSGFSNMDQVIDAVGSQLIGIFPKDEKGISFLIHGNKPVEGSAFLTVARAIARRLLGIYIPLLIH